MNILPKSKERSLLSSYILAKMMLSLCKFFYLARTWKEIGLCCISLTLQIFLKMVDKGHACFLESSLGALGSCHLTWGFVFIECNQAHFSSLSAMSTSSSNAMLCFQPSLEEPVHFFRWKRKPEAKYALSLSAFSLSSVRVSRFSSICGNILLPYVYSSRTQKNSSLL